MNRFLLVCFAVWAILSSSVSGQEDPFRFGELKHRLQIGAEGTYKLQLKNNSMFRVKRVELACNYRTILKPSNKLGSLIYGKNRRPFAPTARIASLNLDRGRTSASYRVPQWPTTTATLRLKGAVVPVGKRVRLIPRIEDVVLEMK